MVHSRRRNSLPFWVTLLHCLPVRPTMSHHGTTAETEPLLVAIDDAGGRRDYPSVKGRVRELCPRRNPRLWLVANGLLGVWSIGVLQRSLQSGSDSIVNLHHRHHHLLSNQQHYIVWCLVTTLFWLTEICFHLWDDYEIQAQPQSTRPSCSRQWMDRIQLGVAILFLVDSVRMFRQQWYSKQGDIQEQIFVLVVSIVAYLIKVADSARRIKARVSTEETP